jgi:flagellar hook assembly protein FlgD
MPINITNQQNVLTQASGLGLDGSVRSVKQELGQKDFLQLLTVQLQNQDPLSPMNDMDFIASMSSFSSVEAMGSLSSNFEKFMADQGALNQSMLETLSALSTSMGADQTVQRNLMAQGYLGKEVTVMDPEKGPFSGVVEGVEFLNRETLEGKMETVVALRINRELFPVDSVTSVSSGASGMLSSVGNVLSSVVQGATTFF